VGIKKFDVIVASWVSFINSVVMSILLPLISVGILNWGKCLEGFAISVVFSQVLALIIPANRWGDKFAAACKTKPFSFSWHLVSTAVATLVIATLMSLCMVAYFAGIGPHLIFAWLAVYPYVLLVIYVASLIAVPIGVAIAKKFCNFAMQAPLEE